MRCSSAACSCRSSNCRRSWPLPSPAPMTRFPGSGLLKRIETPEWYFSFSPVVGGIPEDVEQLLSRLAVEARVVGQLFEHDDEAGLLARLVHEVGHAVVQRVQVLAVMRREEEGVGDHLEHVLLGLGIAQVDVEEVLADALRGLHEILHAVGADRLNDVGTDCLQEHVAILLESKRLAVVTARCGGSSCS